MEERTSARTAGLKRTRKRTDERTCKQSVLAMTLEKPKNRRTDKRKYEQTKGPMNERGDNRTGMRRDEGAITVPSHGYARAYAKCNQKRIQKSKKYRENKKDERMKRRERKGI